MAAVIERIDSLEQTVQDFVRNADVQFNRLYNSQRQTEAGLRLFKDEMRGFKDEARRQLGEMNKKWGEISNKLGTLVAPSLPRIIEKHLNEPAYDLMVRLKRRLPDGRVKEFDALVVTPDCVCLNSTKATLRVADVDGFVADIAEFRTFFSRARCPACGRDPRQPRRGKERARLRGETGLSGCWRSVTS